MEFGFTLPNSGPLASPENLAILARRGEEMGFDVIGVGDHIVMPKSISSRYPYSESGDFPAGGECLEQPTLLSFVASHTSTARLLTSVMVLPYRSPVFVAKMLATIDVLSRGRLIVGVGVGWMREEFGALGSPPYDERGAVGDEYINAFKELWTSDDPAFEGKYCSFRGISFAPKPVQKPHPPIWVGGESPSALRRAGRLGDAWYPIGNNPRFPLSTPGQLSDYISGVRRHADAAGKDPEKIDFAYSAGWYDDRTARTLPDGERRLFTGTPDQIAGDITSFEELGVRHLMFGFQRNTMDETVERMAHFVAVVRPLAAR